MKQRETYVLREVLLAVSQMPGVFVWRNNVGQAKDIGTGQHVRFGGPPGTADIIGSARGRALAVEVKTDVGRQSQEQRIFEAAWTRAGGLYVLARCAADAVNAIEDATRDPAQRR